MMNPFVHRRLTWATTRPGPSQHRPPPGITCPPIVSRFFRYPYSHPTPDTGTGLSLGTPSPHRHPLNPPHPPTGPAGRRSDFRAPKRDPKSPSENWKGSCDEGFWAGPRRRGRCIPAAGCNGRANTGPAQKNRRPKGFRGKGRLASLLLGHRPLAGMLPRRASPSGLFLENRTPSNFQTGSKRKPVPLSHTLAHRRLPRRPPARTRPASPPRKNLSPCRVTSGP